MFNPSIDGYLRMPKVRSESWGAGSLPNPLSPASDAPFSGPCASRACGHSRLPCPTNGEAYSEIAHLLRSYPKGLRQPCAWEDSAAWAAHYSHAEITIPHRPFTSLVVVTSHQSNVIRHFRRYLHRRRPLPCLQEL